MLGARIAQFRKEAGLSQQAAAHAAAAEADRAAESPAEGSAKSRHEDARRRTEPGQLVTPMAKPETLAPVEEINEQVKRNAERFPEDFMFRLTRAETENLNRSQILRPVP